MAVGRTKRQGRKDSGKRIVIGGKQEGKRGSEGTEKQECEAAREQASEGTATEEKETRWRWRGNGAKRLKLEADRVVGEHSATLAKLLLEDAKKGKMESARLLVSLSEARETPVRRRKRGLSLADRLAAEPEWDPERDGRHGGLTAADLKGSEEDWESETDEVLAGELGAAVSDQ
jgi:hypothetical protein